MVFNIFNSFLYQLVWDARFYNFLRKSYAPLVKTCVKWLNITNQYPLTIVDVLSENATVLYAQMLFKGRFTLAIFAVRFSRDKFLTRR